MTRRVGRGLLAALLAASAASGCKSYTSKNYYQTPPATLAPAGRRISVTLDRCDCSTCRIALAHPISGFTLFDRSDLAVGVEALAAACYLETTIAVALECGNCPGPSVCTAAATVRAVNETTSMTLLEAVEPPGASGSCVPVSPPAVGCTTPTPAGGQCQDLQTICIDPVAPTIDCSS